MALLFTFFGPVDEDISPLSVRRCSATASFGTLLAGISAQTQMIGPVVGNPKGSFHGENDTHTNNNTDKSGSTIYGEQTDSHGQRLVGR